MKKKQIRTLIASGLALSLISGAAPLEPISKVVDFAVTAQAAEGDTVHLPMVCLRLKRAMSMRLM